MKQEWGGFYFFSGNSLSKAGICILTNPAINCSIVKYTDTIPGRLKSLEVTIYEKDFTVINLYGSNNDDATFFNDILKYLNDNNDKSFIVGGDLIPLLILNLTRRIVDKIRTIYVDIV